jgi:hypothetical protein
VNFTSSYYRPPTLSLRGGGIYSFLIKRLSEKGVEELMEKAKDIKKEIQLFSKSVGVSRSHH